MKINTKTIGSLLIGFSITLLLLLTFIKLDNDEKSAALCENYYGTHQNMEGCPVHQSNFSWVIIIAYGLGFIILAIGIYTLFIPIIKKEEQKKEFKKIDASKLNDDEKNIYNSLMSKSGSAYQSDLIKETGLSKVKISRILDKLELKEIIERKRRGMTNIIVLK